MTRCSKLGEGTPTGKKWGKVVVVVSWSCYSVAKSSWSTVLKLEESSWCLTPLEILGARLFAGEVDLASGAGLYLIGFPVIALSFAHVRGLRVYVLTSKGLDEGGSFAFKVGAGSLNLCEKAAHRCADFAGDVVCYGVGLGCPGVEEMNRRTAPGRHDVGDNALGKALNKLISYECDKLRECKPAASIRLKYEKQAALKASLPSTLQSLPPSLSPPTVPRCLLLQYSPDSRGQQTQHDASRPRNVPCQFLVKDAQVEC